jgi:hypothetical protein
VQTDRTFPNNKLDITIRDNEMETRMLQNVAISGDRNVTKKEADKIIKYKDPTAGIKRMWNANHNGGNWKNLKIIHKTHEKHKRRARNLRTSEISNIEH